MHDANNCVKNGWYICNVNTPDEAWWYVFTAANYSNAVIVQKAWYYNSGKVIECMRLGWLDVSVDLGGGWQPWEYVNPPLRLGTEYRTTERYLNKPVYVKAINCGVMTNNKTIAITDDSKRIVDLILKGNPPLFPLVPNGSGLGEWDGCFTTDGVNITLYAGNQLAASNHYAVAIAKLIDA